MSVRAKFKVVSKTEREGWGGHARVIDVNLSPVTSGSEENKSFYAATPDGQIQISCAQAAVADRFTIGREFYVDFTDCADLPPAASSEAAP